MRQQSVKSFYWSIPDKAVRIKFLRLMEEWDGSKTVYYAFYDSDVLHTKLKEAKEN